MADERTESPASESKSNARARERFLTTQEGPTRTADSAGRPHSTHRHITPHTSHTTAQSTGHTDMFTQVHSHSNRATIDHEHEHEQRKVLTSPGSDFGRLQGLICKFFWSPPLMFKPCRGFPRTLLLLQRQCDPALLGRRVPARAPTIYTQRLFKCHLNS